MVLFLIRIQMTSHNSCECTYYISNDSCNRSFNFDLQVARLILSDVVAQTQGQRYPNLLTSQLVQGNCRCSHAWLHGGPRRRPHPHLVLDVNHNLTFVFAHGDVLTRARNFTIVSLLQRTLRTWETPEGSPEATPSIQTRLASTTRHCNIKGLGDIRCYKSNFLFLLCGAICRDRCGAEGPSPSLLLGC